MVNSADRIIDLTFDLSRFFRHRMMQEMKGGRSVNFLQLHALVIIDHQDGMTMKDLAKCLKVSSPSATSFVNRLVKERWVRREHDLKNRKLVRLTLAPAGKKILREKMGKRRRALRRILGLLSQKEQAALSVILQRLLTALQQSSSS